ncbi:MAG TPA: glycine/sarcosine/betaine reductase selenoprotein B family protein [Gaiellaceae bacterium]|nr:glycine/sarcosine/betaine reductase selenoprotein B family protein [Gaiellaceae bacterium]
MSTDPRIGVRLEGGLDADDLAGRYADWLVRIEQMHQDARPLANPEPAFTTLSRPLAEARVGLLTSAGAYLDGDTPFDVEDPHGDPSVRVIPGDVDPSQLRFAHSHYDTTRAEQDPNVVLPVGPLGALVADGAVGATASLHVGMMGFNPDPRRIAAESAPRVVELFAADGVDVVVLSPG